MTVFLHGHDLSAAATSIMKEPGARCAVAFWGAGSDAMIAGKGGKVICNLSMGGTNPFAMRKVATKAKVLQCDTLHAKVYIGARSAVVASANASANGLGLEGVEQANWIEAGVKLDDTRETGIWFDAMWAKSREITDEDWKRAEVIWRARQAAKPTLSSFAEFDASHSRPPLLWWEAQSDDWDYNRASIESQNGVGALTETMERRIDYSVSFVDAVDLTIMEGRWVLCWNARKDSKPRRNSRLWWTCLGKEHLKEAWHMIGEETSYNVVLPVEPMPPYPFEANEPKFRAALLETLSMPEFASLLEDDEGGTSWFGPREEMFPAFWRSLKEAYLRAT